MRVCVCVCMWAGAVPAAGRLAAQQGVLRSPRPAPPRSAVQGGIAVAQGKPFPRISSAGPTAPGGARLSVCWRVGGGGMHRAYNPCTDERASPSRLTHPPQAQSMHAPGTEQACPVRLNPHPSHTPPNLPQAPPLHHALRILSFGWRCVEQHALPAPDQ